jgi:hypothetical protein
MACAATAREVRPKRQHRPWPPAGYGRTPLVPNNYFAQALAAERMMPALRAESERMAAQLRAEGYDVTVLEG